MMNDFLYTTTHTHTDGMLFEGDHVVSYANFFSVVNHCTTILSEIASGTPNRIGIYMQNSIDYVVAYYSVLLSGNIVVPIHIKMTPHELNFVLTHLTITTLITNQQNHQKITGLLKNLPTQKNVTIVLQDSLHVKDMSQSSYRQWNRHPDDVAIILHTSGSLSQPKSVMLTSRNLLSCAGAIIEDLHITQYDKTLVWLPMQYASANTSQLVTHVLAGAKLVFTNLLFTAENFFRLVEQHGITNITLSPSLLLRLLGQAHLSRKYVMSSLRYICYGGAPSPQQKITHLIEEYPDIQFVHMYGQTEATTRISHYHEPKSSRKPGCVGKPIACVSCWIETDRGVISTPYETGEVIVAGASIMKGYFNQPEETQKAIIRGCLHTGDIGYVDSDGDLFIVGRKKNIIIKGGENIYPEEIEEVLLSLDAIKDVMVVGMSDEEWGEVPVAYVVKDAASQLSEKQVIKHVMYMLSPHKAPRKVCFTDEIVRTATGKLSRTIAEKDERVMIELKKTIARLSPVDTELSDIKDDTDLIFDLGYDSISIIQLIVELENQFDIVVDDGELVVDIVRYEELKKLVRQKQPEGMKNDEETA